MKNKYLILIAITFTFFSCNKIEVNPNDEYNSYNSSENTNSGSSLRESSDGLHIGHQKSGKVDCSLDDDILESAIESYYGGGHVKRMIIKEKRAGTPNNYFILKGRVKHRGMVTRFAFELTTNVIGPDETELYLPYEGTEQHVVSIGGCKCKLRVTSPSTGYLVPDCTSNNCLCFYGSSTSTPGCTDGTNGLILKIQERL